MINSIKQIPLAVPYPGVGEAVHVQRGSPRFQLSLDDGLGLGRRRTARVDAVKNVNFKADDQHRQQQQRIISQIRARTNNASVPGSLTRAKILGELINQMGGAESYSSPGQLVNIAV